MKKDEITRVRLLSLAVLMALSLFILFVLVGNNEFGKIISKMNNNYTICITIRDLMLYISYFSH